MGSEAMLDPRVVAIIRQFPQNGMKLLLENAKNVRDLLLLAGVEVVSLIDFERLAVVQTTFVERDYRHVESDVVLTAPLRRRSGRRSRETLLIYILIEHQSEPDRIMPLRVLEYVVQIFKTQLRDWSQRHRSFAGIRLQPVLPIVFYTGTRRWKSLGSLVDLVEMGERFRQVTPSLEPLFINLADLQPEQLESQGGFFGWVLRLVQQRQARPDEFDNMVRRVVQHLETMPPQERLRWLELLSYIHALVYHERDSIEHGGLQARIEASVQTDEHRQEVFAMRQTIAEALREEGRKEGRQEGRKEGRQEGRQEGRKEGRKEGEVQTLQEALLQLLRIRFRAIPPAAADRIQTTDDVRQLKAWLRRVVTAPTFEDMRIHPTT